MRCARSRYLALDAGHFLGQPRRLNRAFQFRQRVQLLPDRVVGPRRRIPEQLVVVDGRGLYLSVVQQPVRHRCVDHVTVEQTVHHRRRCVGPGIDQHIQTRKADVPWILIRAFHQESERYAGIGGNQRPQSSQSLGRPAMLSCGSCNSTTNPFAPTLAGYFGESRICAANLLSNWRVRVPALNGLGRTESKESVNVDLLSYTDSSMPESPLSSAKPRNAS